MSGSGAPLHILISPVRESIEPSNRSIGKEKGKQQLSPTNETAQEVNGEEWRVFSPAADLLIDSQGFGARELAFLGSPAFQKYSSVKSFSTRLIPDLLARILPPLCLQTENRFVLLEELIEKDLIKIKKFLPNFWLYVGSKPDALSAIAQSVHVVPAKSAWDSQYDRLLPLSRMSNLMATNRGDVSITGDMMDILTQVGVYIVSSEVINSALTCHIFWDYIWSPNRSGILSVLGFSLRNHVAKKDKKSIGTSWSALQRDLLRDFLATVEPIGRISGKAKF